MTITTTSSIRRRRHEQAHNARGAEVFNARGVAPAAEGADVLTDHTQTGVVGERPPLTGRGSGKEKWVGFATANGYEESDLDGLTREQIAELTFPKPAAATEQETVASSLEEGEPQRDENGDEIDVTRTPAEGEELEADTEGDRAGEYEAAPGVDSEGSLVDDSERPDTGEQEQEAQQEAAELSGTEQSSDDN